MTLQELKNPLENRPTVLRVYRSVTTEFNFTPTEWQHLNLEILLFYKSLTNEPLKKVGQKKIWGTSKSKRRVHEYPGAFIPVMRNIIKECLKKRSNG